MKLSLVIPAYNEAENIAGVVRGLVTALRASGDEFEIVVVDNGSTDATSSVLADSAMQYPELTPVKVEINTGYGNGILAGLAAARGDILGWMHADNQARPEDVAAIYEKLKKEDWDLVKAVRVNRDESRMRIVQSAVYNTLFRMLFGGSLSDINATPKMFTRRLYEECALASQDWFIDPEIVIKAIGQGTRIGEVGVPWGMRSGGSSHVSAGTWMQFLKNMIAYKIRSL